jgi:hypothetical protein
MLKVPALELPQPMLTRCNCPLVPATLLAKPVYMAYRILDMKLTVSWKSVSVGLTAIVLLGAAVTTVKDYRFWAWAEDLENVAEVSYATAIKWEQDTLRGIQLAIDKCLAEQDCPASTMLRLRRQEQNSLDEIERLKKGRDKLTTTGGG